MAGLIPRDFIEDLVSRVDIVEVIGTRVQLQKKGREFAACCPFHTEKTPSFYVSPAKQFYHCFGCGAHGNALGFLIEYEHLEFVDAVEELARMLGVEVPRESGGKPRERAAPDLYAVLADADRYFRRQLREATVAVDYLKGRGLSGEIAAEFGVGYAPPGWDNLVKALGKGDAKLALLERAGLAASKDGRRYDRFRNRVMFPIRDARGRTIAFGGRVLDPQDEPKYLNSPETPVFHKGRELYGLYEAKQALREIPRLLVVEGYMDVLALAQHGIRYAVATLGTATTAEHLKRLFRVADELVFCFDGDTAGRTAAWRALEHALPEARDGRQMRFLFLPDGEDPDSLVRREGAEAFESRIENANPLSKFLLDGLAAQTDLGTADGQARLVDLARPLVSRVPEGVFRLKLIELLGERARVNAEKLTKLIGEAGGSSMPERPPMRPARLKITPVRRAVQMLLHRPDLAGVAGDPVELAALDVAGAGLLAEMIGWLKGRDRVTAGMILEHWRDSPHADALGRLARAELLVPEDGIEAEFKDTLERLVAGAAKNRIRQRLAELTQKERQGPLSAAEMAELKTLKPGPKT